MIIYAVFAFALLLLPCCSKGEGRRCTKTKDCKKELVCNHGYSPPVCKRPGKEGEHCSNDRDCLGGDPLTRPVREAKKRNEIYICNKAQSPATCRPPAIAGGKCARNYECETNLTCRKNICTIKEFECHAGSECGKGLFCNHGYSPPLCKPPGRPGEKCGSDYDCSEDLACVGNYMDSICKERLKQGETCNDSGECEIGLVCNAAYSPPVCKTGKDGEICKSDYDCVGESKHFDPGSDEYPIAEEHYICNEAYSPPVCKLPGKKGHICNESSDCSKGLTCTEKMLSRTCKSVDADEEKKCIHELHRKIYGSENMAQKSVCQAPRKNGELCLDDSDCAENLFCAGGFDIIMPESVRKCMEHIGTGKRSFLCEIGKIELKEGIGECRHTKVTGNKCKSTSECKSGLVCDDESSPPVCKEKEEVVLPGGAGPTPRPNTVTLTNKAGKKP